MYRVLAAVCLSVGIAVLNCSVNAAERVAERSKAMASASDTLRPIAEIPIPEKWQGVGDAARNLRALNRRAFKVNGLGRRLIGIPKVGTSDMRERRELARKLRSEFDSSPLPIP